MYVGIVRHVVFGSKAGLVRKVGHCFVAQLRGVLTEAPDYRKHKERSRDAQQNGLCGPQ